jgi:DNA-binding GntR family transcriptional regulator
MATTTTKRHVEHAEDEAYLELKERIVSGILAPGSRLIETTLIKKLDANRYSVRSAIERLEHEGFVERLPGGRARWEVSSLTIADFREVSGIMGALHGWAGKLVAELDDERRREIVADLRSINEELRIAATGEPVDRARAAALDTRFHRRIVDAVAGPRLSAILQSQEPVIERYERSYMVFLAPTLATSADEHDRVIDAIDAGDPEAVEHAIENNWKNAADRYAAVMEDEGERGNW